MGRLIVLTLATIITLSPVQAPIAQSQTLVSKVAAVTGVEVYERNYFVRPTIRSKSYTFDITIRLRPEAPQHELDHEIVHVILWPHVSPYLHRGYHEAVAQYVSSNLFLFEDADTALRHYWLTSEACGVGEVYKENKWYIEQVYRFALIRELKGGPIGVEEFGDEKWNLPLACAYERFLVELCGG